MKAPVSSSSEASALPHKPRKEIGDAHITGRESNANKRCVHARPGARQADIGSEGQGEAAAARGAVNQK